MIRPGADGPARIDVELVATIGVRGEQSTDGPLGLVAGEGVGIAMGLSDGNPGGAQPLDTDVTGTGLFADRDTEVDFPGRLGPGDQSAEDVGVQDRAGDHGERLGHRGRVGLLPDTGDAVTTRFGEVDKR